MPKTPDDVERTKQSTLKGVSGLESDVSWRRLKPLIRGRWVRPGLGFALAIAAVVVVEPSTAFASIKWVWEVALFLLAWLGSTLLTDKYVHKYPYRYFSYLAASHAKAAAVMAALLALLGWIDGGLLGGVFDPWPAFGLFVLVDFVLSLPHREAESLMFDPSTLESRSVTGQTDFRTRTEAMGKGEPEVGEEWEPFSRAAEQLDPGLRQHIRKTVPDFDPRMATAVVEDRNEYGDGHGSVGRAELLVSLVRINDLRRINHFLLAHMESLVMGGYFVCQYHSLESVRAALRERYGRLFRLAFGLNFLWHRAMPKIPGLNKIYFAITDGRNRHLSQAEVWGRLSYCGLRVVAEERDGRDRLLTARRVSRPIKDRKPSFYPVIGLAKVGLDGQLLRAHKVRSMYPYSEFLQERIFEEHGLATTGKFQDDFRLTEYGPFLRRYWIDELPGLYDWLRGEIKLVGIRATSPHYLSLYPEEFIDLYVKVKPGLIPPVFDEQTEGLEEIIQVEWQYLKKYVEAPVRTDARSLFRTLRDIVVRGVRSK